MYPRPSAQGYPPEGYYPPQGPRPRRRTADLEELTEYLQDLDEEITRVRGEVEEIRRIRGRG